MIVYFCCPRLVNLQWPVPTFPQRHSLQQLFHLSLCLHPLDVQLSLFRLRSAPALPGQKAAAQEPSLVVLHSQLGFPEWQNVCVMAGVRPLPRHEAASFPESFCCLTLKALWSCTSLSKDEWEGRKDACYSELSFTCSHFAISCVISGMQDSCKRGIMFPGQLLTGKWQCLTTAACQTPARAVFSLDDREFIQQPP